MIILRELLTSKELKLIKPYLKDEEDTLGDTASSTNQYAEEEVVSKKTIKLSEKS